jgi:hypothetical protein
MRVALVNVPRPAIGSRIPDDHLPPPGVFSIGGPLIDNGHEHQAKHFAYAAGWKKFEPLWDIVIKTRRLGVMTPLLEGVLSKVSREAQSRGGLTRDAAKDSMAATTSEPGSKRAA